MRTAVRRWRWGCCRLLRFRENRGSAASFITNKLLGLTTVDRFNADIPIYPERFLTKERVLAGQMPDIDMNVATQEPFVRAARKLLGEHGCYPLMAIEKLKEKAAWQLYAGANDVRPEDANQISKYLDEYNKALKYADDDEKEDIHVTAGDITFTPHSSHHGSWCEEGEAYKYIWFELCTDGYPGDLA